MLGSVDESDQCLLEQHASKDTHARPRRVVALAASVGLNIMLLLYFLLQPKMKECKDPTMSIYSPAHEAVEYVDIDSTPALIDKTAYMGFPTNETDRLWEDLYDFGVAAITEDEALRLHTPTIRIPGRQEYVIELDVWHQLHCLNDLRKLLYPERFGGMADVTVNGTINRDFFEYKHWEHCVDALRQSIMCHSDVSPISWRLNLPAGDIIIPRLANTHTCRNFSKIREWAKNRRAGAFQTHLSPQEAAELIEESAFDMGPEEHV